MRWAGRAALVLPAFVALLYLVGANLFLGLGFSKIFESTNQVNVTFGRAWTWWPGVIHLREVRLVFQDHNVQFTIALAQAVVDVRLLPLASRTFHATRVEGDGLRFLMRHRIAPEAAQEPWVEKLPPIPEFEDPPLFESYVPEPPVPDSEYDLWTVHLEGVEVRAEELWAQFIRYRGAAVARGAFRLRPARHLWVGPATLEIERGTLHVGDQPLASRLEGRIDCTVHPFDVRIPVGNQVFRHISAHVDLTADGVRLDPSRLWLTKPSAPELRSANGTLRVLARLAHGRFSEQSRAEFSTAQLELTSLNWFANLAGVRAVLTGAPEARGALMAQVASASVHARGAEVEPLHVADFAANLTSSSRDTTQAWEVTRAEVEVGTLKARELGILNAAFQRPAPKLEGALHAFGRAHYREGKLDANATLRLEGAGARSGSTFSGMSGELTLTLTDADVGERSGKFDARVRGKSMRSGMGQMKVESQNLALDAHLSAQGAQAVGKIEGSLGSLSARGPDYSIEGSGQVRATLEKLDLRSLQGNGRVALDLDAAQAESGPNRAKMTKLEVESEIQRSARGLWDVLLSSRFQSFTGVWEDTSLRGKPEIHARLTDFDPESGRGSLNARLTVTGFESKDRDDPGSCPFSRIKSASARAEVDFGPDGAEGVLTATATGAELNWDDFRTTFGADVELRVDARRAPGAEMQFSVRTTDLKLRSGSSPVHGWEARAPALRLDAGLRGHRKLTGELSIQAPSASGRIGRTRLNSSLRAKLQVTQVDLDRREGRLQGEVQLADTHVQAGDERVEDWWARIQINSALLRAADNLDVSSLFRAELRDATPGLAALSAEGELPGWLVSVLPLRELDVQGSVNRRCRLTDIHFTSAEGGPLTARGRLQSKPEGASGAFLVRLSSLEAISTGIRFGPTTTKVEILAGNDWLQATLDDFDVTARQIVESPCEPAPSECSPSPSESF